MADPKLSGRAEAALEKFAYAEQFSRQQRHRKTWVKVVAIALFMMTVIPAGFAVFVRGWPTRLFCILSAALGFQLLSWLLAYSKGSSRCPHCRQDITNCTAGYCPGCGEMLKGGVCPGCGLAQNWTALFQKIPVREPIMYCPGCGVYLNSTFYRFEKESDSF